MGLAMLTCTWFNSTSRLVHGLSFGQPHRFHSQDRKAVTNPLQSYVTLRTEKVPVLRMSTGVMHVLADTGHNSRALRMFGLLSSPQYVACPILNFLFPGLGHGCRTACR
ncbi:hypothetical protein BDW02DRAFT_415889 [Decorospora gaudefroyi]|uniref:Uncharacterized protein n=1 Tax=Decorospora gaudefroyi TaxID=184978 RepID=A0A6A5K878_9PLEO|nr:hypothetical protein BDW02DRAFT_415889 [Decorospora gaudefroyi]